MNKIYVVIIIFALLIAGFFVYNRFAYLNIIVKFDTLEPFQKQVPVYYKGFKVGKSVKIYPDKHYQNTYIKLQLTPADVELPRNIIAKLQTSRNTDFINLIPPEEAEVKKIKEGDIIEGTAEKDINGMLTDKLASGSLDSIVDNASNLMDSANQTVKELGIIFSQINEILADVKTDIKTTTSNLAKTTQNLENLSANVNNSLDSGTIDNSVNNIEQTTENIKGVTTNLNSITEQIDKVTIPSVNSILCQTHSTVKNTNEITHGIKHTLKKHMGLGRIIFGKPINNCN